LSVGIENAEVVCCFITPEYQASLECRFELQYAKKRSKKIITCILTDPNTWIPTDWLHTVIHDVSCVTFYEITDTPDSNYIVQWLIYYMKKAAHPKSNSASMTDDKPSYIFELIKYEYQRNSRIEHFMNPAKSFPIEESYINLSIVKIKDQQNIEEKLKDKTHEMTVLGTYEEIYSAKHPIKVKDMLDECKHPEKRVLLFGRAGIGKSTFCRYVAYQWAKGLLWPQYELLLIVPLRRLNADLYSFDKTYSLLDIVKREIFTYEMSEDEQKLFKKQLKSPKTLWIFDGYDEISQTTPQHLTNLLDQLLKTPQYIVTSRPYKNTLSFDVNLEITGFTDENIKQYIHKFFYQFSDESNDTSLKKQSLLQFLKLNSSAFGVAHIPINLDLICCIWSNERLPSIENVTITKLYTEITEWLCQRYLQSKNIDIDQLLKDVYEVCQEELEFLQCLAFEAMKTNTIIIPPSLLEKTSEIVKISLSRVSNILNFGVLKTFSNADIGDRRVLKKDHYFIHLSFQEYFAARHIVKLLKTISNTEAAEFIHNSKYDQRYALMFTFTAGLLSDCDNSQARDVFWDIILGDPIDIIGIRHLQLVIRCLDTHTNISAIKHHESIFHWITRIIQKSIHQQNAFFLQRLSLFLQTTQFLRSDAHILNELSHLLQSSDKSIIYATLDFVTGLQPSSPTDTFIRSILTLLRHDDSNINVSATRALKSMDEKAITAEVISKLVSALEDQNEHVRSNACRTLGLICEKEATTEVISKLVSVLKDESELVRSNTCLALGSIGGKAATNEVISKLVNTVLEDKNLYVRSSAWETLGSIGGKAATSEMISKLLSALEDQNERVRSNACRTLGLIREKAATIEVISKLVSVLEDESELVRSNACLTLGSIGGKAATNEVISKLVRALEDQSASVRSNACRTLGLICEKAATTEVISKLVCALEDQSASVRSNACEALESMGKKVVTSEVIIKLVCALEDQSEDVRSNACEALGSISETAVTTEVISKLVCALEDQSASVRSSAWEALVCMDEKAATNEMISKLLSALEDQNERVRSNACRTLGLICEKAATTEVISKLVCALEDQSASVRSNACLALGSIGGKAATNEVISKLVCALEDQSASVRSSACEALESMDKKVVTSEVIIKLVCALEDQSEDVRSNACEALGSISETATTTEVISKLVSALDDKSEDVRRTACQALSRLSRKVVKAEVLIGVLGMIANYGYDMRFMWVETAFVSVSVLEELSPIMLLNCYRKSERNVEHVLRAVSMISLVNVCMKSRNPDWLPVISHIAFYRGVGISVHSEGFIVYEDKEPVMIRVDDHGFRKHLYEFLREKADGHGLILSSCLNKMITHKSKCSTLLQYGSKLLRTFSLSCFFLILVFSCVLMSYRYLF